MLECGVHLFVVLCLHCGETYRDYIHVYTCNEYLCIGAHLAPHVDPDNNFLYKKILRAGIEPATSRSRVIRYSLALFQLSYRGLIYHLMAFVIMVSTV